MLQLTRKLLEGLSALFGAGFNLGAMTGNQALSKLRTNVCHFVGNSASCSIVWFITRKDCCAPLLSTCSKVLLALYLRRKIQDSS
jgi:hypothetical protein